MINLRRTALICTLALGALAASSFLGGCANDVPTPPWLPNYTASGYGGKGGAGGKGGGAGGAAKAGAAGQAGEAGDTGEAGSGGDGGDGP